ncbi:unnamed protein product [Schistocephalus solidus]|uniref:PIN_6 domain-containing protein n=1 Tax=Schistocephalus solidus TaxID=70667 RepID=A0A183SXJ6_SCHSO|nr:unnamed protein product [Schistocephalus solidus]
MGQTSDEAAIPSPSYPTNENNMSTRVFNLLKRSLIYVEISLLSKAPEFGHNDVTPTNVLASFKAFQLTSAIPEDMRAEIHSCASGLLRQTKHRQVLSIDEEKGLRSLKTDDSIVILTSDKGGATVIKEKINYSIKANQIFNDQKAYTPLAEDPTKNLPQP